jgi:hypothetical protein
MSSITIYPEFTTYNNQTINHLSIDSFKISEKSKNDENNKTREHIICAIINNKVPDEYYSIREWIDMKNHVIEYLNKLNGKPYDSVECKHEGGRGHKSDFKITFQCEGGTKHTFKVELKYNALTVEDAPQFVSPGKPSKFMTNSYEEYYYDHYLPRLQAASGFQMPPRDDYLKQVHGPKPTCLIEYKELYDKGCKSKESKGKYTGNADHIKFHELCKKQSVDSIREFLKQNELNIEEMSKYLAESQKDKKYMLYSDKCGFAFQEIDEANYTLVSVVKKKNYFECITKANRRVKILLRWKNGNGIAYPAFQISLLKAKKP